MFSRAIKECRIEINDLLACISIFNLARVLCSLTFGVIDDTIYRDEWDVAMSLCGGLNSENPPNYEQFNEHLITYEQFVNDPAIFKNPNLIFRINGQMYDWETACPLILSLALYRKSLPKVITHFVFFCSYIFKAEYSFKTCLS